MGTLEVALSGNFEDEVIYVHNGSFLREPGFYTELPKSYMIEGRLTALGGTAVGPEAM